MSARTTPPVRNTYWARRAGALVRCERIRLLSLRSTWIAIALLSALLLIAGVDGLRGALRGATRDSVDPVYDLANVAVAQFAAALLGLVAITGEYATGAIYSTALASPWRLHAYVVKAAVVAGLCFAAGAVYAALDLAVLRPALGNHAITVPAPTLVRAAVGVGVYLAFITLLAFGIGAALRYSAGALATLGALLFFADQVVSYRYLPAAGTDFVRAVHRSGQSPWQGLGVLATWTAASLIVGAIVFLRREL